MAGTLRGPAGRRLRPRAASPWRTRASDRGRTRRRATGRARGGDRGTTAAPVRFRSAVSGLSSGTGTWRSSPRGIVTTRAMTRRVMRRRLSRRGARQEVLQHPELRRTRLSRGGEVESAAIGLNVQSLDSSGPRTPIRSRSPPFTAHARASRRYRQRPGGAGPASRSGRSWGGSVPEIRMRTRHGRRCRSARHDDVRHAGCPCAPLPVRDLLPVGRDRRTQKPMSGSRP